MSNVSEAQHFPAGGTPLPAGAAAVRWTEETVLAVRRWTPRLMSLRISRNPAYRFSPGHYARVGLADPGAETVWRPLSMVSSVADDYLEFVIALIPGGAFSELVAPLAVGSPVLVEKGCFGFLTLDQLATGEDLWLMASGTGIGPFVSLLRDGAPWRSFDHILLAHSVRHADELVYRDEIEDLRRQGLSSGRRARLQSFPVVTREACAGAMSARIPQLIADGRLEAAAGVTFDPSRSRVMACGNPDLMKDLRTLFSARGFQTGRRGVPGQIAFEKYW